MKEVYYKVIDANNRSCHGGDFDWTPYLPKGKRPGKWTPAIENVEICVTGYHVTQYWNMWYPVSDVRIFECNVKGLIFNKIPGVVKKEVCERIQLIKEIFPLFDKNSNTGSGNTGSLNTGDANTGSENTRNRNSGNSNTGYSNTGDRNSGDGNSGDRNTGNCNTGYQNAGDCNSGNSNAGDRNSGNSNAGNWNTGDRNAGNWNAGNWNIGDGNSGSWNTGNCNAGFFNAASPDILVFNKPCKWEDWIAAKKPDFIFFDIAGNYKASWRNAYDSASAEDKLLLVKLPNFDREVFQEISGIMVDENTGQEEKNDD